MTASHSSRRRVDEHAVAEDAGVVHDDVERAERGDRRFDDVRRGVEVGDVVGVGDRLAAERADLLDDLVHRLVGCARAVGRATEVVDHDLGALACECQCVRAAEAPTRSSDHDDSSVADTHRLPPSGQDGNVNQAFAWQSSGVGRSRGRSSVEHVGEPSSKLQAVRDQIDHPIVDADAHQLEVLAVVMDFIRDVGGPDMPDKLIGYMMNQRRAFRETARRAPTTGAPPCRCGGRCPPRTRCDRATTVLPGYLYERLDEIGLDFTIVYPGQGLQVITLPGMADDDLRRAVGTRVQPLQRRDVRPVRRPHDAGRGDPDAHAGRGDRGAATSGTSSASRPACSPATSCGPSRSSRGSTPTSRARCSTRTASASTAPTTTTRSGRLHRPRRRAHVPLGPDRPGLPRRRSRATSTTRSAASPRAARHSPSRCSSAASPGGSRTCASASSRAASRGAQSLYCRMLEHWKKRNGDAIVHLDPQLLDTSLFAEIIDAYAHPKVKAIRDRLVQDSLWSDFPEVLDDWWACEITERRGLRPAVRAALLSTGARATTAWSQHRWTSGSTRWARACSPCSAPTSATST